MLAGMDQDLSNMRIARENSLNRRDLHKIRPRADDVKYFHIDMPLSVLVDTMSYSGIMNWVILESIMLMGLPSFIWFTNSTPKGAGTTCNQKDFSKPPPTLSVAL
jgi:hypothetical protein